MTEIYVQIGDQYAGRILLADSLKPTTESLIKFLRQRRVKHLILLTGDSLKNAQQTVASLNLDDVKAGLLPADKLKIMENYRQIAHRQKHQVMFVGDGVNDAPVLESADVSVAMGQGGAAAAIELADIVLLKDQPQQLQQVFELADKTKKIVWENIGLALIIKFALLLLGAFGLATLWEAVFADVGVTLLAVFNALRLQWQRSA
jgi:Cd2+/Zn2+-exporting ATPase